VCNPSRDEDNLLQEPWSSGFTQAVYQVESYFEIPDRQEDIPDSFSFSMMSPRNPPDGKPELILSCRMRASVTNLSKDVEVSDWAPRLPERKLPVRDYRFTDKATNWPSVTYAVTNWQSRTSPTVLASVRIHEAKQPVQKVDRSSQTPLVRFVIFACAMTLPLAVVAKLYWNKRRQQNKQKVNE
jgi:hypothetical protein